MTEHLCCVCPQLRPGEPRIYERANVCQGCRARLRALLAEVVEHYDDYVQEATVVVNAGRWTDETGRPREEPIAAALPVGPLRSGGGQRVSGSRTPPLPLPVDTLDATLLPRPRAVSSDLVPLYVTVQQTVAVWLPARPDEEYATIEVTMARRVRRRDDRGILAYGLADDQVGEPSIPAVLDSWATDWQTYEWALLPEPTVPDLVAWLTDRLEWACDQHPAVDDFAFELAALAARIRPRRARPELKINVPCRECDMAALYRVTGSDYVECGACPALLSPEEYSRWTELITAKEHLPWVREVLTPQRASSGNGP